MLWNALFVGWVVCEILIAIFARTKQGYGRLQDRGTMPMLWIAICLSITVSEWAAQHYADLDPFYLPMVAVVIMICGLMIRVGAVISLGKAFSVNVAIRDSQTLNQNGLYRFIRHPSYLGLELIFVAIGLSGGNPVAFLWAFVPPTAALLYRIHVEEKALVSGFGASYQEYQKTTKRLVPWIY